MAAIVKQCKCEHPFQDSLYGKGNRLHTEADKGDKCTVCGTRKGSSSKGKR